MISPPSPFTCSALASSASYNNWQSLSVYETDSSDDGKGADYVTDLSDDDDAADIDIGNGIDLTRFLSFLGPLLSSSHVTSEQQACQLTSSYQSYSLLG
jgi:hypothetical protein